jgi:hypothetical protein
MRGPMTKQRSAYRYLTPGGAGERLYGAIVVLVLLFAWAAPSFAEDEEDCLLCHRYPGLARVDEEGKFRLLFVNEEMEKVGSHGRVKCGNCHDGLKKIPHEKKIEGVDCIRECHVQEPSTKKKFSHKPIQDILDKSVHGKIAPDGKPRKYPEDLPNCKSCHENPLYRPLAFYKIVRPGLSERALGRCRACHEKEDFLKTFYMHVSGRLHKSRAPQNVIEVCGRCHEDSGIIKRHDLPQAAFTFKETFHGKGINTGSEKLPDCTDCHVKEGKSVHTILPAKDPLSSVNKNNRSKTCSQPDCHPKADKNLADFKVHLDPHDKESIIEKYTISFFILLTAGTLLGFFGLLLLEQVRFLFPDVAFRKERRDGHGK